MKEKPFEFKKIKKEEVVHLMPLAWCGAICRNAMSEICGEQCAPNRDISGFELKKGIDLIEMPRFPIDSIAHFTKEERLIVVAVYNAKIVDHLKGVIDEPAHPPIRRPDTDRTPSSSLPPNIQIESVLHGVSQIDTPLPVTEKREDQTVGPTEVAGTTD